MLIGGTGRNIIIGGAGADTIDASRSTGDNILIGGTTIWDANAVALQAIMQEWTNTSPSFDQRVNALRKGITVGGKTYALNTSTVLKDSSPDSLIGGGGQNWFFADFDDVIDNGNGPGPNDRSISSAALPVSVTVNVPPAVFLHGIGLVSAGRAAKAQDH